MAAVIEKLFKGKAKGKTERFVPREKRIRVAAYCRVSTNMEIQQNSLDNQMSVFRQRILEHPGWELAGIYADEGISGTQTKHRTEFLRMVEDAKAGKIDYIITKSISRFARNTVECIETVRMLQSIGVQVLFEKENIDTGTAISEMVLTVLAAFAQEESRSISENLKWGIRKRYESGQERWSQLYGYRKGDDDEWVVVPEEAETVKAIFEMYEYGSTSGEIASQLNGQGKTSPKGKKWTAVMVCQILNNEKYVGDIFLQKYISTSFLTHKSIKNDTSEVPGYYVTDHHTPIISRQTFDRVNRIKTLRFGKNESGQYPYGDTELICPCCGERLVQRILKTGHKDKLVWICFGENGCRKYGIKTALLDEAVIEAAQKHMMAKSPETIQYWWLDEFVERIEPQADGKSIRVTWKDGGITEGRIRYKSWQSEPYRCAAMYKNYYEKLESGERIPEKCYTPPERQFKKKRECVK